MELSTPLYRKLILGRRGCDAAPCLLPGQRTPKRTLIEIRSGGSSSGRDKLIPPANWANLALKNDGRIGGRGHRESADLLSATDWVVIGTTLRFVVGGHHTQLGVLEGEVWFLRRHDGAEVADKTGNFAVVAPNVLFVAKPIAANTHHP